MKATATLILVFSMTLQMMSQDSLSRNTEIYAELILKGEVFSNKFTIKIDYGQLRDAWVRKGLITPKDQFGDFVKFNSLVDALNYMNALGWEFVCTLPEVRDGSLNNMREYHYLLRHRISTK